MGRMNGGDEPLRERVRRWAEARGLDAAALAELQALWDEPADEPEGGLAHVGSAWLAGVSGADFTLPPEGGVAPQVDDEVLAHLELRERLGVGGMGEVWRAVDVRFDREVAVKVLRPELAGSAEHRARFLAEARAQAQLVHPGVVPIHERGLLPDGRPVFTMAVNRGRTLHEAFAAGDLPLRRRVELVRRACEIVAFAHDRGVCHRDLKPANVMVGAFGEVQVLDWGLVEDDGAVAPVASTPSTMARETGSPWAAPLTAS